MTEWALIFMMCSRMCEPQYALVLPSKAACEARMQEPRWWGAKTTYCVPILKEGQL